MELVADQDPETPWYLLPLSDWLSALRELIVNLGVEGIAIFAAIYIVGAIVLALVAAGIGGRAARLATWAVAITAASFAVGLAAAVITSNPLW